MLKKPVYTVWGEAQSIKKIAEGITLYTTASHGGFHISEERFMELPKPLKDYKVWNNKNWYEEDCDWVVVVLGFPQYFEGRDIEAAKKSLKLYNPETYNQLFLSETNV
jgi:hypothetical protein